MLRTICISFMLLGLIITTSHAAEKNQRNKDKAKPPTADERIDQLLHTLQDDRKEEQRAKAAEELLNYSSQEFPEIVPALINALVRDNSASVRKTAVKTLADVKPPTQEIKDALEQAVKQDKSWSVRQAARWAAWHYKPKDEPAPRREPQRQLTSKPAASGKMSAEEKNKVKPTANDETVKELPKLIAPPMPVVPAQTAPPPPPFVPLPSAANVAPPPPAMAG